MLSLTENFLTDFVKDGALEVALPSGKLMHTGDLGVKDPPRVALRDSEAQWKLLANPELAFGELYMDGRLEIVHGSLDDVVAIVSQNAMRNDAPAWLRLLFKTRIVLRSLHRRNNIARARRNVAHHYDLGNDLYALFLDEDWQYSCAYFERDDMTLEEAQLAKRRHISAKLAIEPGQSVLDIGCGWGGLDLYLARVAGASVTGISLSKRQLSHANRRAARAGLSNYAHFRLCDYRNVKGCYDRIVSIGMFEHVGFNYYQQFFEQVAASLSDNGVALLHTIGRTDGPGVTSPWVDKYIFPGGYIPGLSEIIPHIERAGLVVLDIEVLRLHYAKTLQAWADRFRANRDNAKALFDERFCRMWEFYLASAKYAFIYEHHVVWQIQMAKNVYALRHITRDYITECEKELRARESPTPDLRLAGQ